MKIFISHASEQTPVAEAIEAALGAEGHNVFLDRSDLGSGRSYNDAIRNAIAGSDLFVFLITPEAVAPGRYTLNEVESAKDRWSDPSGRVLPVMIKPTNLDSIPAYLKAVTILEPEGNVPASVAAAVSKLTVRRRPHIWPWAAAVLAITLIAIPTAWWAAHRRALDQELATLLGSGRLQQESGKYSEAWDTYERAGALAPSSADVVAARERLAMDWLDNIRVTVGQGSFTAIVQKVEPVLGRCAVSAERMRAADCLAHLGWGDFLRKREGVGGLDPAKQYRQALERDSENVYAHAMLGFDTLTSSDSLDVGRQHFDRAMAAGRERDYVRRLQFAGLLWRHDPAFENEAIRVANEMRLKHESMPVVDPDRPDKWRLWNVYYDRLLNRNALEPFLRVVPAADHVATFLWLFPESEVPADKRGLRMYMLATLEEHAGRRVEALARFRALRDELARVGALAQGGSLPEGILAAIKRLSR